MNRPTSTRVLIIGCTVAALVGAALIAWLAVIITRPDVFDPLGDYPTQQIVNELAPGASSVVLAPGQQARVRGTKCNNASEPVKVRGSYGWVSVDPGGTYVPVATGNENIRVPGCTTQTFLNDMPDGVTDAVRRFAARGITRSVWRITGTEVPQDPKTGAQGEARIWVTENFTIDTTKEQS